MLAYQVCECTRSRPAHAAAIATSVERMCKAGLAVESGCPLGERRGAVSLGAHAEHVEVDQLAQMPAEEVDVDAGAAVDVWGELG